MAFPFFADVHRKHAKAPLIDAMTLVEVWCGGKDPSFIDKRQLIDFKEIYHNRIALGA